MPRKIDPALLVRQVDDPMCSDPYSIEPRPQHGFWRIPPEIYGPLDREFGFDFDPCPNPRPAGFDGRTAEWGQSNWVNPPFWGGLGPWSRKAVEEHGKGKGVAFIAGVDNWIHRLVKAGAVIRPMGNHDWIHTQTGARQKAPRPSLLFVLPKVVAK